MPPEERLIGRNVLHTHNPVRASLDDAVDKEKRISVRQALPDRFNVIHVRSRSYR